MDTVYVDMDGVVDGESGDGAMVSKGCESGDGDDSMDSEGLKLGL